ncbi:hypothetical protein ACJIZ3_019985 [Penstemon smallii]|uniref:cAMP-regulated phosphoprotein 19-related protein n=1 Tax=Penstemon smallii TaxID=265156 RepID=A0ABD3SHA9_9LAMI
MEEFHTNEAKAKEMNLVEGTPKDEEAKDLPQEDFNNCMPSPQQEEEILKKKYGGLLPKKSPLISKDNERAFFDSADWALGKKSKGPLEALRPKLQPSPHQQVRSRSAYARGENEEDGGNSDDVNSEENQGSTLDGEIEIINPSPENPNHQI